MRRAEIERVVQQHAPVVDLDRLNRDRAPGTSALFLARLALHERAEIPASVGQARSFDVRPDQPHAADHRAAIDELADAVGERDFVDVHERAAFARERDVAELQPAKERSFEAADRQRCGEILVRLPDNEITDAVLRPSGFDGRDAEADRGEEQRDENDERFGQPGGNGSQSSKRSHRSSMVSTDVPVEV